MPAEGTNRKYQVIVAGGGITGTLIARELSKYLVKAALLEKELDVAEGSTKANSAIVHAGFDPEPGTLKATMNARGNRLYPAMAAELGVEFIQNGSLVVAVNQEEAALLDGLYERGKRNGIQDLEIIYKDRLLAMEPNLSPASVAALYAPSAGVTCPFGMAIAAAENAVANGVELLRGSPVAGVLVENGTVRGVQTPRGHFACDYLVNAAGIYADEVARLAKDESIEIHPRRGQYHILDRAFSGFVRRPIFPVPTKVSKGIVVIPTVDGNTLIGPDAEDIDDKEGTYTTAAGLKDVVAGALRLVPNVASLMPPISQYSGLRAVEKRGDFVIGASAATFGLVNVAGIQSPGLTAGPAVAEMVVEILKDLGLRLDPNPRFVPERKKPWKFASANPGERARAIADREECGHIVCRCENVSESEILDALRSPAGALTLDGVKRRTRAGMGRCQGGFCTPRIVSIVANELGIKPHDLLKDGPGSCLLSGATKAARDNDGRRES